MRRYLPPLRSEDFVVYVDSRSRFGVRLGPVNRDLWNAPFVAPLDTFRLPKQFPKDSTAFTALVVARASNPDFGKDFDRGHVFALLGANGLKIDKFTDAFGNGTNRGVTKVVDGKHLILFRRQPPLRPGLQLLVQLREDLLHRGRMLIVDRFCRDHPPAPVARVIDQKLWIVDSRREYRAAIILDLGSAIRWAEPVAIVGQETFDAANVLAERTVEFADLGDPVFDGTDGDKVYGTLARKGISALAFEQQGTVWGPCSARW